VIETPARMRTAAVVVTWEGGEATLGCVASLRAQVPAPDEIVVVDNASCGAERARLAAALGETPGVRLLLLDENRQFAGGLNAGAAVALAAGADRLLFLNNDTRLEPTALARLGAALDADPAAGIAGPVVLDARRPGTVLTAGEWHDLALLCVPRSLLRPRRPRPAPYRVRGVMGCALLVTRACYRAVGGFAEDIEVYYEDVDFCLAARAAGFAIVVAPAAIVHHDGMRGFAAGLTPWAAFLKARNPWLLVRRRGGPLSWLAFVPSCLALVGASAIGYAVRGRGDVVAALVRGTAAGIRVALGGRPVAVGAPARRA